MSPYSRGVLMNHVITQDQLQDHDRGIGPVTLQKLKFDFVTDRIYRSRFQPSLLREDTQCGRSLWWFTPWLFINGG